MAEVRAGKGKRFQIGDLKFQKDGLDRGWGRMGADGKRRTIFYAGNIEHRTSNIEHRTPNAEH